MTIDDDAIALILDDLRRDAELADMPPHYRESLIISIITRYLEYSYLETYA